MEAFELKDATLIGHSTGGGEIARYIGGHGTKRVKEAGLLSAVVPFDPFERGFSDNLTTRGLDERLECSSGTCRAFAASRRKLPGRASPV